MLILGIDPGLRTGVAHFEDGKLTHLETVHPADIPNVLLQHQPARVMFEDSRLQSHVWGRGTGVAAAAKVARNVGEVDAWCRLIEHTCSKLGIKAHGVSPQGKGAKLDAVQFERLTGWANRNNQHERDAACVCWQFRKITLKDEA
ncbi:MAG: hypothetical protein ACMV1D_07890 [Macromonas sp.]